jgi:dTDP-4-dehydrorhamnose 3,5-epimerase
MEGKLKPYLTSLKRISVIGGDVMHAMKKSDSSYSGFGEAYFSFLDEGCVKAWKKHSIMTLNLVVPVGCIRFVFLIDQNKGLFQTEEVGESRYMRITVPPGIWFGFKGIGPGQSMLMNLADIEHSPEEGERCEKLKFDYKW